MPISHSNSRPQAVWAFVLGILIIAAAIAVLAGIVFTYGTLLSPDSRSYIQAGYNIAHGNGFVLTRYDPATDSLIHVPLTHYPPLTSIFYALGLWLGIPAHLVPAVIVSTGWALFLVGTGALTYRLHAPPWIVVLAVLLTLLTTNYWFVFQVMISEAVFLPLLVWFMVVLVDLPATYERQRGRMILAVLLLAMIMLTRYVGVLMWLASILWIIWWFAGQRRRRALAAGIGLHVLAAVPFGSWVLYNLLFVDKALSDHLHESHATLVDGLIAFVQESARIALPALMPFMPMPYMAGWLVVGGILVVAILKALWTMLPPRSLLHVHRTPLLLFVLFYSLLYTVVQPWFTFLPIDSRDMATLLCMVHPWLFGAVGRVLPRSWSYTSLAALVALNIALAFHPILFRGLPDWIRLNPPQVQTLTPAQLDEGAWRHYGFFSWLAVYPVRTGNLPQYHPELYAWLQSLDTDIVVLTNGPLLFDTHMPVAVEYPHTTHPPGYVTDWLRTGQCDSRHTMIVVLFERDSFAATFASLRQQVEQKCPDLEPLVFPHSVVYSL
jgi:hypothetical protein